MGYQKLAVTVKNKNYIFQHSFLLSIHTKSKKVVGAVWYIWVHFVPIFLMLVLACFDIVHKMFHTKNCIIFKYLSIVCFYVLWSQNKKKIHIYKGALINNFVCLSKIYIQYAVILLNIIYSISHKICEWFCSALLYCDNVITFWLSMISIYLHLTGLLHWHWDKRVISPVLAK